MTWPFSDPPNVAVFTTTQILDGTDVVTYVSRDERDGSWQFLGESIEEADARVVALRTLLDADSTLAGIAGLPLGYVATRMIRGGEWSYQPR